MELCLVCIIILLAVALIMSLRQRRPLKEEMPQGDELGSRYIITRLTQQNFTKAVNIVMDLVQTDGADIEVIYNNQVIFNGYMDRDDRGIDRPHFFYNKKVLDENGIRYE